MWAALLMDSGSHMMPTRRMSCMLRGLACGKLLGSKRAGAVAGAVKAMHMLHTRQATGYTGLR